MANFSLLIISFFLFISTPDVSARDIVEKTFLRRAGGGGGGGGKDKDKVVKLHFYVQDLRVGNPTPTVYEVAKASVTANSPTQYGSVHVVDDLLTVDPDINSRAVGRVQGLTTSADMSVNAVAMNLNFYFTSGKFNGSTISILGRNQVMEPVRELPVVGGTGAFRYAQGYALTSNTYNDAVLNYSILEYTIYTTYSSNPKFDENDADVEVAEM